MGTPLKLAITCMGTLVGERTVVDIVKAEDVMGSELLVYKVVVVYMKISS